MTTAPSTTATIQADGTIDISGNLFRLDALIDGYTSILQQATEQLRNLDVTEEQLNRISIKAAENLNYYRLSVAVANDLHRNPDAERAIERLADIIGRRIDNNYIKDLIRSELKSVVQDQFDLLRSDMNRRFQQLVDDEQLVARNEARSASRLFEQLFHAVFADDMKRQIKQQAEELAQQMLASKPEGE